MLKIRLILSYFFLIAVSIPLFAQGLSNQPEKLHKNSDELIKARLNEGKLRISSTDDVETRVLYNQILDGVFVVDEYIYQQWDAGTSTWLNYSKYDPTYNSQDLLIETLYQSWNGSSWENNYRYT